MKKIKMEAAKITGADIAKEDVRGEINYTFIDMGHKYHSAAGDYRQIPALSTIDKWHYDNGFVDAVPAGESFILSKQHGIEAHFTANVNYRS